MPSISCASIKKFKPVVFKQGYKDCYVYEGAFGLQLYIHKVNDRFHWRVHTSIEVFVKGACVLLPDAMRNCEKAYQTYVLENLDKCME